MKSKDVECNKGNEEVETCNVPMLKDFDEINFNGPPVIKIAAGVDFSMILDIDGNVWTFGSQENGQIGTGTDGSYNSASSKVNLSVFPQTWNLSKNLHNPIFGRKNFTHWECVNGDYFHQQ